MTPLVAYVRFEVGRLLRSWKFLLPSPSAPVIFYILFLGDHTTRAESSTAQCLSVYLMVSMCSFGALVAALNAAGTRLSMERASGWAASFGSPRFRPGLAVNQIVASMLVVLPVIVLVEAVGAGFGDVRLATTTWIGLTVLLWATSLPFAVLGVFIGFLVATEANVPGRHECHVPCWVLRSLFTPVDQMPGSLQFDYIPHAELLPGLARPYFSRRTTLALSHWLVLAGCVAVLGLAIVWKHRVEEARELARPTLPMSRFRHDVP